MDPHIRAVAILHIVLGALTLLAAAIVFISLGMAGGIVVSQGEHEAASILGIIAICVCAFLTLISLPDIVGGWALLNDRPWGRPLVIILSCLSLLSIPVGTAIGAYSLWALLRR